VLLQCVKVGLVVLRRLAGSIRVLVAQREAQGSSGRDSHRSRSQGDREEAGDTHGDCCAARVFRTVDCLVSGLAMRQRDGEGEEALYSRGGTGPERNRAKGAAGSKL